MEAIISVLTPAAVENTSAVEAKPSNPPAEHRRTFDNTSRPFLVAEDNRTNRLLIERMLRPTGSLLIFAHNGMQAVDMFKQHAPGMVLMDISMPDVDGYEDSRRIGRSSRKLAQAAARSLP
jgi:CheY-like chemotaxis protein